MSFYKITSKKNKIGLIVPCPNLPPLYILLFILLPKYKVGYYEYSNRVADACLIGAIFL